MNNPYIDNAVEKIIKDDQLEFPLNFALASCWVSAHFKGENLKICDARGKSSLADYFILMSSTNTTQAGSIATEICKQLGKHKANCLSKEGLDTSNWILLDFGDIIIHIFQENARDIYDLDTLWADYPKAPIPAEYYVSSNIRQTDDLSITGAKNYF